MYDVGKRTMFEVGVVRSKVQADALKLGEGGRQMEGRGGDDDVLCSVQ